MHWVFSGFFQKNLFKITIPAVKITGNTDSTPPTPRSNDTVVPAPDHCPSTVGKTKMTLDPIDNSLFLNPTASAEEGSAVVLTDEEENEFGEFLLDAVDWL